MALITEAVRTESAASPRTALVETSKQTRRREPEKETGGGEGREEGEEGGEGGEEEEGEEEEGEEEGEEGEPTKEAPRETVDRDQRRERARGPQASAERRVRGGSRRKMVDDMGRKKGGKASHRSSSEGSSS